jgi:hypothetical protein
LVMPPDVRSSLTVACRPLRADALVHVSKMRAQQRW